MKSISKLIIGAIIVGGTIFSACNEWTEPEAFTIKYDNIESQNPELYEEYLKSIAAYKNTEHTLVYTWFDNSEKKAYSRAHHLTEIPDSIDVVSLIYPDKLSSWEMEEMEYIRTKKGTKIIYDINFDSIKEIYNEMCNAAPEDEPLSIEFRQYLTDTLSYSLALANTYKYDGINIIYSGKSSLHMNDAEKKEYMENENCFIGIIKDWYSRNENYALTFQGKPQNMLDTSILNDCNVIFIDGRSESSANALSPLLTLAFKEVYADKYATIVKMDGGFSLASYAEWSLAPQNGHELKAAGVYDISGDYHSSERSYKNMREMISILNPSIK